MKFNNLCAKMASNKAWYHDIRCKITELVETMRKAGGSGRESSK